MSATTGSQRSAPPLAWWAIWVSLLVMVFVIGGVFLKSPGFAALPWFVALGPLGMAMILRFKFLLKAPHRRAGFVLFVIGMSMCEMTALIGVLAADQHRETLLLLALLGIVMHMPTFLKKLPEN